MSSDHETPYLEIWQCSQGAEQCSINSLTYMASVLIFVMTDKRPGHITTARCPYHSYRVHCAGCQDSWHMHSQGNPNFDISRNHVVAYAKENLSCTADLQTNRPAWVLEVSDFFRSVTKMYALIRYRCHLFQLTISFTTHTLLSGCFVDGWIKLF